MSASGGSAGLNVMEQLLPIVEDAMAILFSVKKSGATSSQQIPSRIGQCRAGKQPANGEIEYSSHVPAAFSLLMDREAQITSRAYTAKEPMPSARKLVKYHTTHVCVISEHPVNL